jgi:hypothetical protein
VITTLLALLASLAGAPDERCSSTIFGQPGDKWAGGNALALGRPVAPDDIGIAHRRLPLRSVVLLRNERTGRATLATVLDRGPYGATMPDGSWGLKRRHSEPGAWKGCADLTPRAASILEHDGRDPVSIWVVHRGDNRRAML